MSRGAPNKRVQRTRPSASRRASPLTRGPLGNAARRVAERIAVTVALLTLGCASPSRPKQPPVKLIVVADDVVRKALPGASITVRLIGESGSGGVFRGSAGEAGVAEFAIPRGRRFTISAELQGFIPVTIGPIDDPQRDEFTVGVHLELQPTKPVVVD